MRRFTEYVERLTKYFTTFGQYTSAHNPRYRLRVDEDIEVQLSMGNDEIVAVIHCRIHDWEVLQRLHKVIDVLYEAGTGETVRVGFEDEDFSSLEESDIFGGK